ncbi:glycosyltransferase, partial [Clavibacter lycopersici]
TAILRLAADRSLLEAPAREARRLADAVAPAAHARSVEEACRRVAGARRGSTAT